MDFLQTVCRICQCQENLLDLTDQVNADAAEMLASVTTIRIQADDQLPKCLCDECSSRLQGAYEFLQRCEAAERRWQEMTFVKQEPEDIVDDLQQLPYEMGYDETVEQRWQEMTQTYVKEEPIDRTEDQQLSYDETGNLAADEIDMMEDQKDTVFEETKIAEPISIDGTRNKKFFCRSCGSSFDKATDLDHHAKQNGKGRPWRAHLQNHDDPGEGNFPCQSCPHSFKSRVGLRLHVTSVHMGEKSFTCAVCGKAFFQKASLEAHKVMHVQERNYPCEICSNRFKTKRLLREHMVRHVKNLQPKQNHLECNVCHRFYSTRETLRIHKLLHTGKKPFECAVCRKAFAVQQYLTVHMRTHNDPVYTLGKS